MPEWSEQEEIAAGLGHQGPEKSDFTFMVDLPGVCDSVWQQVLCQCDLSKTLGSGTKTGLMHVVTGHLCQNWKAWAAAQASREKMQWIKHGYPMDTMGPVPPATCTHNHKGCEEEVYVPWLFASLEEMLVLWVCAELWHKAYQESPINIMPQGDFNVKLKPDHLHF